MKTIVNTPDGKKITVNHPDGASKQEIIAYAKKSYKPKREVKPSYGEAALTMASGIAAEPIAGLAGLGTSIVTGDSAAGAGVVDRVKENLTFQPRTESGKAGLQSIGETLKPVGDALQGAERFLGENTLEATGSPFLATAAHSIPTIALEALGLVGIKGGANVVKNLDLSKPSVVKRVIDERISAAAGKPVVGLDDAGKFTPEGLEAIRIANGDEAAQAASRFNLFKEYDVPANRFNVSQATDDAVIQQSGLKRTGRISEQVAEQDSRLTEIVDNKVESFGSSANDLPETNANIFESVDNVVKELDDAINQAYVTAREGASTTAVVKFDGLIDTLRKNASKNSITNGVISAVRGDLENLGLIKGLKKVDNTGMRVADAENVRQTLNKYFEGANPQARSVIRELKDSLDDDVARVAGEDVFQGARAAKTRYHQIIERAKRDKRDKTKGSFLESVIDNKIPEDKIVPRLLTSRLDDFKSFKGFLLNDAGQAGKQSFKDIQAQVLRDALQSATKTMGKSEGGIPVFNSRLFANHFKSLRGSGKFKELFNSAEQKLIDDIIKMGSLRVPQNIVQQGKGASEVIVAEVANRIPVARGAKGLFDAIQIPLQEKKALDALGAVPR